MDAFIADEHAERGVKNAVAETVNVSPAAVTVVLEKVENVTTTTPAAASRRLQGSTSSTRLLQDAATPYYGSYVHVESTIAVADADAATALSTRVEAVDTGAFTTTLATKLQDAGVAPAARAGLRVSTVSAPTTVTPAPSPGTPSGTASGAIMTCQTSNLAALFTASAWLASFSCLP